MIQIKQHDAPKALSHGAIFLATVVSLARFVILKLPEPSNDLLSPVEYRLLLYVVQTNYYSLDK